MKRIIYIWAVALIAGLISCTNDNEGEGFVLSFEPNEPNATLYQASATLYEAGATPALTEIATLYSISRDNPIFYEKTAIWERVEFMEVTVNGAPQPYLSYNAIEGTIKWTNELPVGTHTVSVTASLDSGLRTDAAEFIVDNRFRRGTFGGTYATNDGFFGAYQLIFHCRAEGENSGDLEVYANGTAHATGTWWINGNVVTGVYVFDGGVVSTNITGTVTNEGPGAPRMQNTEIRDGDTPGQGDHLGSFNVVLTDNSCPQE